MNCCEVTSTVPDLAGELKASAKEEVRRKGITRDIYLLASCANPYAIDGNVVIIKEGNSCKVYDCGDLVFAMVGADLKRYVCGPWTIALSNEAEAIKRERARVKKQDRMQRFRNKYAMSNYVVCQQ